MSLPCSDSSRSSMTSRSPNVSFTGSEIAMKPEAVGPLSQYFRPHLTSYCTIALHTTVVPLNYLLPNSSKCTRCLQYTRCVYSPPAPTLRIYNHQYCTPSCQEGASADQLHAKPAACKGQSPTPSRGPQWTRHIQARLQFGRGHAARYLPPPRQPLPTLKYT